MKRMLKLFCLILILFLVGCNKNEYITCNINVNNSVEGYSMTGTYKIYYDDSYVTKIEKKEEYISPNESIISYFEESKNLEYYNLNDLYGGVTYNINNNKKKVDINVTIDMNLVDIKKMIKNGYLDKDYVISNSLTTSGIVKVYESKGAICDI